jgi:hypothetical protein
MSQTTGKNPCYFTLVQREALILAQIEPIARPAGFDRKNIACKRFRGANNPREGPVGLASRYPKGQGVDLRFCRSENR